MIEIQETSWYSDRLGREMPVKRYGTKGKPCLVIPSQDGKHNDFESFGMVEACRPFNRKWKTSVILRGHY